MPRTGPCLGIAVALALLLGAPSCGGRHSERPDSGPDGGTPADGDVDADADTVRSDDGGNDAGADADADLPSCSGGRHGRTITVTNASSVTQHVDVESPLSMSRSTSEGWAHFSPWLQCAATCDECSPIFCEACDPALRILAVGESLTYTWQGEMYLDGEALECDSELGTISCVERLEAPAGTYRIELCHSPTFSSVEERFGACYGTEDHVNAAVLDDPRCLSVELEYDPCSEGSVEITITDS